MGSARSGSSDKLLTRNRFMDRTEGIGVISKEMALAYGLTGPNLRATGVDLDLRKDKPYLGYDRYDFDVPVGTTGDCYDRYLVRGEEIRQSVRIIRQVIETFPEGPICAEEAKQIVAPPKSKVLSSMEELIQNFMITTEGPRIPAGEGTLRQKTRRVRLVSFLSPRVGRSLPIEDPGSVLLFA